MTTPSKKTRWLLATTIAVSLAILSLTAPLPTFAVLIGILGGTGLAVIAWYLGLALADLTQAIRARKAARR